MRSHRALRGTAIAVGGSEGGGGPLDDGWPARFEAALSSGGPLGASDALRKSGTNGWVRKASYDRALPVLERLRPAPLVRLNWAERLMAHPRRVDKELAAEMLAPLAKTHTREVARAAYRLAPAEDWGVPEAAAMLLAPPLGEAFNEILPTVSDLAPGPG